MNCNTCSSIMICKKVLRGLVEWFCPICYSITSIAYVPVIEEE